MRETRLYQIGTFAAGNRLLDPDQRSVQAQADRTNAITSGHRACQGCGEACRRRHCGCAATAVADSSADPAYASVHGTARGRSRYRARPCPS